MSKLIYVKKQEVKHQEIPAAKRLIANHGALTLTVVIIVGLSTLIGIGFAYMGYTSGEFSEAYMLCKNDVLSQVRIGAYQSPNEITAALESCK
jgi:hypothetical protein